MTNKFLIAIDLDGTLLTSDYKLSDYSVHVLNILKERGHEIVLASGRPPRNILPYYKALSLSSPIIAYNGLLSMNPKDPSFPHFEYRIDKDLIKKILSECELSLKNYLMESDDRSLFLKRDEKKLDPYFPYGAFNRKKKLEEVLEKDPFIAVFEGSKETEEKISNMTKSFPPYAYRHWSNMPYSELYIEGKDKGNALKEIAKTLQIPRENVIAFGDGNNDESMIAFAKYGFAIANSKSALLLSKYPKTMGGNNEDGVAKTLAKFFSIPN